MSFAQKFGEIFHSVCLKAACVSRPRDMFSNESNEGLGKGDDSDYPLTRNTRKRPPVSLTLSLSPSLSPNSQLSWSVQEQSRIFKIYTFCIGYFFTFKLLGKQKRNNPVLLVDCTVKKIDKLMFYQDLNDHIFLSFVLFELKYNTMILFVLVKLLKNYSLIDRNRFNSVV